MSKRTPISGLNGTPLPADGAVPPPPGRRPDGKFAAGNPGGPGRPRRAVEADFLRVLLDELSLVVWRRIVREAIRLAVNGNDPARRWLSTYAVGNDHVPLVPLVAADVLAAKSPDEGEPGRDAIVKAVADLIADRRHQTMFQLDNNAADRIVCAVLEGDAEEAAELRGESSPDFHDEAEDA